MASPATNTEYASHMLGIQYQAPTAALLSVPEVKPLLTLEPDSLLFQALS